jgi:hypothetical protein
VMSARHADTTHSAMHSSDCTGYNTEKKRNASEGPPWQAACLTRLALYDTTGRSWKSILNNMDFDEPWAKFAGPGSLNDPDM